MENEVVLSSDSDEPQSPQERTPGEQMEKQRTIIRVQRAMIQQQKQKLTEYGRRQNSFMEQMSHAKEVLNVQLEENKRLVKEVHELGKQLRRYREPDPADESWNRTDELRCAHQPSWRILKPYRQIFENIREMFPNLLHDIHRAMELEKEHYQSLYVVKAEDKYSVSELLNEAGIRIDLSEDIPITLCNPVYVHC